MSQEIMTRDPDAVDIEVPAPGRNVVLTPMDMLDKAVQSGAGVEVLERLMGLQERWEANQARKAFDAAIAKAKAEIPAIVKNKLVDFVGQSGKRTTYKHETLDQVVAIVQPILSKHGLDTRFRTESQPGFLTVICRLAHEAGHSEENSLTAPVDTSGNKNAIQAIGSAQTYLQRYTLKAALGLAAAEDDDGRAGGGGDIPEDLTPDELADLRKLIDRVDADEEKFARFLKVRDLPSLPRRRFEEARHELLEFGKRNGRIK